MSGVPIQASPRDDLASVADRVLERALALGAREVQVRASRVAHVELSWREGRIERASQAVSQGVGVALLVDDRFSRHGTSDLRPEALDAFLARAVEATRVLEPEPDRRLAPREEMGALDPASLELHDPAWDDLDHLAREERVAALAEAVDAALPAEGRVSTTTHLAEATGRSVVRLSNGFGVETRSTRFGLGGEVTLAEGDRLPEAATWFGARHREDLPDLERVAADLAERARMSLGARPAPSARLPVVLDARVAGRFLGAIVGPLSGRLLHEGRSLYKGRLGERLGSPAFTLWDDPTIPRGLGSTVTDGDGFLPRRRALFEEGVLRTWLVDLYHARKLGIAPTTGGTSNLVMAPGERSWREAVADAPRAIRITGFLGGNTNPSSGEFSFGIRGQLLERGEPVANVAEMNVSGNLLDLLSSFREACDDVWTWSATRVPSLVFDDLQVAGT